MLNFKNMRVQEFPGGPVVKNPPDKAADTGLTPDLGRFHMLRVSEAHAPQLLIHAPWSPGSTREKHVYCNLLL